MLLHSALSPSRSGRALRIHSRAYASDLTAGPTITRKKYSELKASSNAAVPLGKWVDGSTGTRPSFMLSSDVINQTDSSENVDRINVLRESDVPKRGRGRPKSRPKASPKAASAAGILANAQSELLKAAGVHTDTNESDSESLDLSAAETQKSKVRRKRVVRAEPIEDHNTHDGLLSNTHQNLSKSDGSAPKTQLQAEILDNLHRFPHCVLLTRVGQFYESYFDQAAEVAQLLNIKLTSRVFSKQRVHMCGFPLMHLQKHLKTLVQNNGRLVALCEEFARPAKAGQRQTFDRRVVRVVTPGTLIDEHFLDQYENNFLMAISPCGIAVDAESDDSIGLAWIDISTGEFFTRLTNTGRLRDELARIMPKEVVLPEESKANTSDPIRLSLTDEGYFVSFCKLSSSTNQLSRDGTNRPFSASQETLDPPFTAETRILSLSTHESVAVDLLTTYLSANLLENAPAMLNPSQDVCEGRMLIDAHTIKELEIRESMREGGTTGSLLNVIRKTVTSGGTRLLARWLCSPSTSLQEIRARQSLVSFFFSRPYLREDVAQLLREFGDATRVVQKFILGRGDSSDLVSINSTFAAWESVRRRIDLERSVESTIHGVSVDIPWASLDILMSRLNPIENLSEKIKLAVPSDSDATDDLGDSCSLKRPALDVPSANTEVISGSELVSELSFKPTICPEFSPELTGLHNQLRDLLEKKQQLEEELRTNFDAPSLTLRSSLIQGLHVHIGKKKHASRVMVSPQFIRMWESNTTSVFLNQDWTQLGTQIVDVTQALVVAERRAFEQLRQSVISEEGSLRRNARVMDELDVALSLADLAHKMKFVRPVLTDDLNLHIVNGRHPTVELGLLTSGRIFTPNTVKFSSDSRLHVITGPNMAGKSTLLRQTALIVILAQIGSFVPADSATIGLVDGLYSRVGAKDDLFRDRSTFMVEMLETSEILRRASQNSLVIMDEVGRGTTMKDGLAIAFATVHHLYSKNMCRTMFATHFHELADLLGCESGHKGGDGFEDIAFFCTDVDRTEDGSIAYSHQLRPGVNRDSHGIKVAQLAGLPDEAVTVAEDTLRWLKQNSTETPLFRKQLQTFGHSVTKGSFDHSSSA